MIPTIEAAVPPIKPNASIPSITFASSENIPPIINAVRKQIAPTANDSKRRFHSIVNPKTDASILKFSGIR